MIFRTSSSDQTKKIGERLAGKLSFPPDHPSSPDHSSLFPERSRGACPEPGRMATVVALQGDLGAGKTTFVQGFLGGLGIKSHVTSPTFVLSKRYRIKNQRSKIKNVYHMDWYRLKSAAELQTIGYFDLLSGPENLILIEWPEKIPSALPKGAIKLSFQHGNYENIRKINIKGIKL